jgi:hypothetical protein
MKNLSLLFTIFYTHLVFGQDYCPDFKPLKKNVKIIKVSPDLFTAVTDADFVVIPNFSGGLEFSLGTHFSIGGTIGGALSYSFSTGHEFATYPMFRVETKYYPSLTFNKWWYGLRVSVLNTKEYPIAPLPTLNFGFTQNKPNNRILDYTAGIIFFDGAFILNTGISWGFIYSKNKRVRA